MCLPVYAEIVYNIQCCLTEMHRAKEEDDDAAAAVVVVVVVVVVLGEGNSRQTKEEFQTHYQQPESESILSLVLLAESIICMRHRPNSSIIIRS